MNNRFSEKSRLGLAPLMGVGCGHSISWHDDELGAILEHQLSTSLICDLAPGARNSQDFAHLQEDSIDWSMITFAELLQHPAPPLPLLRLAKDFAKRADNEPDAILPSGVAMALYYACISAALIRRMTRITSMSDDDLRQGLLWVDRQAWIDSAIHHLAREGLKALDSPS